MSDRPVRRGIDSLTGTRELRFGECPSWLLEITDSIVLARLAMLILLLLPALFFFLGGWSIRAYFRSWFRGTAVSSQVPRGSEIVTGDTADRCALPIGLMWVAIGLILVCSPWATSRGEKIPSPALHVAAVGVALEAVSMLLFAVTYLFNRPKFLLPPSARHLTGIWGRDSIGH
jgi:hypothetical protein